MLFAEIASGETDWADVIFLLAAIAAFLAVVLMVLRARAITETVLVPLAVGGIALGLMLL